MNCQFCGSQLPPKTDKCPNCGAIQGLDASIPPPSPYYEEVIPSTPPADVRPEPPVPPAPGSIPEIPPIIIPPSSLKADRSTLAIIALVLGIIGIPAAFMTVGCSLIMNLVGIVLAWFGLKSDRRGMAIVALILNIGTFLVVIVLVVLFAGLFTYGVFKSN